MSLEVKDDSSNQTHVANIVYNVEIELNDVDREVLELGFSTLVLYIKLPHSLYLLETACDCLLNCMNSILSRRTCHKNKFSYYSQWINVYG